MSRASKSAEPVVELDDVQVHFEAHGSSFFGEQKVVKAVDEVDLTIYENDVVVLVGESGCGKTTLGKTAIGLQRPTGGTVRYRGQDVHDAMDGTGTVNIPFERIRRSLQIIHQDPGSSLNPNRTVLTNLAVPMKKYRPDLGSNQREEVVHKLLERVGITPATDYATRFPHQLSGGEQQRVALARSLLMEPDLILADEAVSALDVSLRVQMMDLMLDLRDLFDTSYLVVSHDFANARYLAEKADGRIGVMYLGKLVEIGTVDELIRNPKHPYTQVLIWSTPMLDPRSAAEMSTDDPPVRSIDIPTPDDPPGGCHFHTRCPVIIPPADLDIEQHAYNDIIDLRLDIEDEDVDVERVWAALDADGPELSETERSELASEFAVTARKLLVDADLNDEHREVVERALEDVATDDWERAAETLRSKYESVCERKQPQLQSEHPVACHLYDDEAVTE
ncbi:oligopeptide/dipeptide ABC transporter ATP-binding protein [Haloarchaeobius sp. TZWSO28]|uniref:oligopeptide/dipeptide ABC transporter ATP-binding protein n=1 Tax=Haloarchaeobius sp. TZWSO28 TaxID=3446119 RepID=UPI003EBE76E2